LKDLEFKVLKISKSTKKISLQRFLLSKIVYEKNEITERDILAIFQNQISLQEKASREKDFSSKFGNSLEELSRILKEVNLSEGFKQKAIDRIRGLATSRLSGFLIPQRNYSSFKTRFNGTYSLVYSKSEGIPTKDLPPVAYIGVGYKDKGSTRKEEFDASPDWKDVARSVSNIERIIQELQERIFNETGITGVEKLKIAKTIHSYRNSLKRITSSGSSQRSSKET